ncbi:hypothetical protein LSTR_LSTR003544 [Laodelphax striatellus]|uniref:Protein O-mannosyl-transferase 2 n=2 Tax=Laodelphax striatellus TaxID=195883 RepID=A0A482WKU6_LAOST|nr:hypothetical protein LSTR_LSTR003544 [Laodelphax striatellus]
MNKQTKEKSNSELPKAKSRMHEHWWKVFLGIVVLSAWTRFYKVTEPDHMLIALSGYTSGYDGSFPFEKPGDKYENVNYVGMRLFCTFLGACIPPMAFLTVWEMTYSLQAAVLSSLFILCDVGILTLTQYILLDPILLFFVMGTNLGVVKVHACRNEPFSLKWWTWLVITGVMLSCAVSVKFVGLFVVMLAGLRTLEELWDILGDLSKPVIYTAYHFVARALCLIVLPAILYTAFFYIHLKVLSKSGNGDGFYSSAFQSQLEGNSLHNASLPKDVAYGAIVTLKNHRTGGGYLHSHWHLYPEGVGARQQQITTYTHKDENNKFLIKYYNKEIDVNDTEVVLLRHGDLVRLEHVTTHRNLHSHREPAPISKKHYQVTGYGENGVGDANDVWKVQIVGGREGDVVHTVTSKLKFIHALQHCILTTSNKQLPKWAYEQQEVSCNPNLRDKNAIWNVEDNVFDKLPIVSFDVYAPGFIERFIESHAVMFQGNAGLKPKEGEVTSRPWQWPINFRGQFFSGNPFRIYLLGNPVIWWANLILLLVFIVTFLFTAVREQRGYMDPEPFNGILVTFFLESIIHILPEKYGNPLFHSMNGIVLSAIAYSFYLFAPLAYGMEGPSAGDPESVMHGLKWLDSWEF